MWAITTSTLKNIYEADYFNRKEIRSLDRRYFFGREYFRLALILISDTPKWDMF